MSYTIGIDLGGTTMTAGLVNEDYEIVGKTTWATRLPRPAADLEAALAKLCRTVAKENNVPFDQVRYVGIGTPGSVNFTTGFVGYNTNFNYYDWNLGSDMEALLGCKVYVENDANAAAYGEYIAGGAKGYSDAVIITLGTGIGSGIILGGKILRGFNFAAGEMGHTVIVKDGRPCNCGRKGCWERYASTSALVRRAVRTDPALDSGRAIFAAARQGDKAVLALLEGWIAEIAEGLAGLVHLFNPQLILIGGGVSSQQELLIDPLARQVKARVMPAFAEGLELRPAALANDAGLVGAVRYFLDRRA